jgi:hypothetical protein
MKNRNIKTIIQHEIMEDDAFDKVLDNITNTLYSYFSSLPKSSNTTKYEE